MPEALSLVQGHAAQAGPPEPVLDVHQIQGNVLVGFNKDHQRFLFLQIGDRARAKQWLRAMIPSVATVAETLAERRLRRAMRTRRGSEPTGLVSTWVNLAFTAPGLEKLTSRSEVERFTSDAFKLGMHQRAALLGDPTDAQGGPFGWKVGDASHMPDVLVIIASDRADLADGELGTVKAGATAHGLTVLFEQPGDALPGALAGHEHFGFKDGVSQPGIRGRVSDAPEDFLTPRIIDPADPLARAFAQPGQPLLWPGQFVLGKKYPVQSESDPVAPQAGVAPSPAWTENGSFVVWRRLGQNVEAFHRFAAEQAALLAKLPDWSGMTAGRLEAFFVGRWPSGTPVMRAPSADDEVLAANAIALNQFQFSQATQPARLEPGAGTDPFPAAPADESGFRCPFSAHIRKVNPRDDVTELGGASRTLPKRILRRGIAFGPPLDLGRPNTTRMAQDRGLVFVCYQSSIETQFEFLMTDWANSLVNPRSYNAEGAGSHAGHDPIIGQHAEAGGRKRVVVLPNADGTRFQEIVLPADFVIPTGGAYLFSPSIKALTEVLSK